MARQARTSCTAALAIRPITEERHAEFLEEHPMASFLQNPRWPEVKVGWRSQLLGAFDGEVLVASALTLGRPLPVLSRKFLAYLPEGPVFDPDQVTVEALLPQLVDYLRSTGAFLVRVGMPGTLRRWSAQEVRRGLLKGDEQLISQLEPIYEDPQAFDVRTQLQNLNWIAPPETEEFEVGQPRYQARIPLDGSSVDDVLARMDQTSRRQTRKSLRSDLTITVGTTSDLPAWQALYTETAQRDGFGPRPLAYFERMFAELNAAPDTECTLYFASFQDRTLAAAIYVRQGKFAWYVYGASSPEEPKRYAPRALQLRQVEEALAAGCHWYDLGGVTPSLESGGALGWTDTIQNHDGADVVETLGEWDYPVNPLLAKVFNLYMSWR